MNHHPEIIGDARYALPPQQFFDHGEEIRTVRHGATQAVKRLTMIRP